MSIDIAGPRAIAQSKMTISQRAPVEGIVCDVVCTGRFYDLLEKRDGRWGMIDDIAEAVARHLLPEQPEVRC